MSSEIPFIRPRFPASADIASDFEGIVESNWFTNFGPRERAFSTAMAEYVGEGLHAVTFAKVVRRSIQLTPFGVGFCKACLVTDAARDFPEHEPPTATGSAEPPKQ